MGAGRAGRERPSLTDVICRRPPDLEKRPCANTDVIPDSARIIITTHGEQAVHRMTNRSLTEETLTTGKAARHDLHQVLNLRIPGHGPSVLSLQQVTHVAV